MLNGDFSVVASATCGKAVTLTNPSGGAPFPGNQLPVNLMDPAAVKLASNYLPTAAANGCGTVTYGIPRTGDEQQWIERTDRELRTGAGSDDRRLLYLHANPGQYGSCRLQSRQVIWAKRPATSGSPWNEPRLSPGRRLEPYTVAVVEIRAE